MTSVRENLALVDDLWMIGLSGWVLQDGNYPDLYVGDRVDFALEFSSRDLHESPQQPLAISQTSDGSYDVTGVRIEQHRAISVLDLGGVRAYSDAFPPGDRARRWPRRSVRLDGRVAGTVHLSVDPFFFMDEHAADHRNPPLIYGWVVETIAMATGPMITIQHGHPLYVGPDEGPEQVLDPARLVWRPLDRTRMWEDEQDGIADYLLGCRLVERTPTRTRFHLGPQDPARAGRGLEPCWPRPTGREVRDELLAAYAQPHRGYHDLRHLEEVLENLERLECDDEAVLLAAWFHDAVYDGTGDDEERSAAWAEQALADDPALAAEVGRLVRLTATHRPEAGDRHGQLLCDADLAILAAGPERYAAYVAGVRQEYSHVPDADFRLGRRAVLEDLLGKDRLFETDAARDLWEETARANLTAEIAALS